MLEKTEGTIKNGQQETLVTSGTGRRQTKPKKPKTKHTTQKTKKMSKSGPHQNPVLNNFS